MGRLATPDTGDTDRPSIAPFAIPPGGTPTTNDTDDGDTEVIVGLLRGLLRGKRALVRGSAKSTRSVRAAVRGLPSPVVSRVGKGAATLGDAVGVMEAVADTAHRRQAMTSWTSRTIAAVKQAAPHFVREAVLGTALFAMYEELSTLLGTKVAVTLGRPNGIEQVNVRGFWAWQCSRPETHRIHFCVNDLNVHENDFVSFIFSLFLVCQQVTVVPLVSGWASGLTYGTMQAAVDAAPLIRSGQLTTPPLAWMTAAARIEGRT